LVDDDALTLAVLALALKHFGFEPVKVDSGAAAVEVVAGGKPAIDLVVLDMKMPVMDGEQTFLALRKLQPSLPFLIYSGWGTSEAVDRILMAGGCAFLPKTFSLEVLREKIQALLQAHPRPPHP
jgi:DNA-binding response OmpR family regulator